MSIERSQHGADILESVSADPASGITPKAILPISLRYFAVEGVSRRLYSVVALLLALGWAVAGFPSTAAGEPDGSVVTDSGNYVVEYSTNPSPIPTNKMFEMTVIVRERLKRSNARNVTLEVRAGMSVHNHGMNTMPVVERLPDRRFRVKGMLFHMAGPWEIEFLVKRGIMVDRAEQVVYIR